MPHIIVEYSDHLEFEMSDLLEDLHRDLSGRDTITPSAIKTRAIPIKSCVIGEPADANALVHIALKLLSGRSDELRKEMAQGLFDTAKTHFKQTTASISAETVELHNASYIK